MDAKNKLLNLFAPFSLILFLSLVYPPLYFIRQLASLFYALFPQKMRDKVVLITGASSGIGEQLAYQYAKRGANLVLVARREGRLRETADRSKEMGSPDVLVVQADVSVADDCRRFVETAVSHFGRLDHLVNNAGISCSCLFEDVDNIAGFSQMMDINFWGLIYPTHYALPHLKKTKGRIVVTSSVASWLPMPRMSFYNASKAALTSFYETLRVEIGRDVGVTIASPSWTESEITQGKVLNKEGQVQTDQDLRDTEVGTFPLVYSEACSKEIVDSACQGKRHVTVPSWFRVLHVTHMIAPEFTDWCFQALYLIKLGSQKESPSKRVLDATGAKELVSPSSQQETKED